MFQRLLSSYRNYSGLTQPRSTNVGNAWPQDNQQCFLTFAALVKKLCNDFKLAELTADDFRSLIFSQGLVSAEDAEVRRRVLTKLENEQGVTLQKLTEDCQRVIYVKGDLKTIEESGVAQIWKIRTKSTS